MGKIYEDWRREAKLADIADKEPRRVSYARQELAKLGYPSRWDGVGRCLIFTYNHHQARLWPYTGWYAVKGLGSGRGVNNLLRKLSRVSVPVEN